VTVYGPVLAAAALGGASAGALGVVVVGLRMPFLAVFTAHAALAGALIGRAASLPQGACAFAGALLGAAVLGWLLRDHEPDPNAALGSLFSLALGVAFLAMALAPGSRAEALSLLWGSLLFVTGGDVATIAVAGVALAAVLVVFDRPIRALLFSRQLAALLLPTGAILALLLVLAAGIITVNLDTVGGLFIYSLITNPAVAAARLARSYPATVTLAALLGAASALAGFGAALWLDLPVGACIVLASSLVVGLSALVTRGAAVWSRP